jgi:hypothetical protein
MHFILTSASWLNLVERFFLDLTVEVVREGSFTHVKELSSQTLAYLAERKAHPMRYAWKAKERRFSVRFTEPSRNSLSKEDLIN